MDVAAPLLPIAHAGHWAFYIVYAVPVVVVLYAAVSTTMRERRLAREGAEGEITPRR